MLDPKLEAFLESQAKKTKALEAELAAVRQGEQTRQMTSATELIDDAFDSLGEDYATLFGKGPAADLGEAGKGALARRIAVLNQAGVNLGNASKSSRAKIRAAAEVLFPREPKPVADEDSPYNGAGKGKKPAGKVSPEEWAQAGTARPTQRAGAPEVKGPELAKRNLARKMNQDDYTGDAEIRDGLLP